MSSAQFYEWFYVTIADESVKFPVDMQRQLEEKYYQAVHQLYDRESIFVPSVSKRHADGSIEVINVIENQRIVEKNRKFSVSPVYRIPKIKSESRSIADLGACSRWIVNAQADSFVLGHSAFVESVGASTKPEYQAFKVHSIAGVSPEIATTSMQVIPNLPQIVARIGKHSYGRNWELPQIMFSAQSKTNGRLAGLHIQITPSVLANMKMNFSQLKGKSMKFEFVPNSESKIVRKGNFEYLCLDGKHVDSQTNVCMVVGVHVLNAEA